MLYDYLLTQFYPKIGGFVLLSLIMITVVIWLFFMCMPEGTYKPTQRKEYIDKYKKPAITVVCCQVMWLAFLAFIPDANYIKHFYGGVREITPQQREIINQQLVTKHKQSQELFLKCLEKGQKQPQQVKYNDTNEVVKTCYKVAQYKF